MGQTIRRGGDDCQTKFSIAPRLLGESDRHGKLEVKINKPIYAGMSILDIQDMFVQISSRLHAIVLSMTNVK